MNQYDLTYATASGTYQRLLQTAEGYVYDGLGNTFSFGGNPGPQGYQGPTGPQGIGVTGSKGDQGFQGPTGSQGFQGPTGPQGFQGNQGFQGPTGPQGFQGPQGVNGTIGIDGATGPTGPQGNQGFQGPQGFQGSQGFQGNQGFQGPTGPQGNQGSNGSSTSLFQYKIKTTSTSGDPGHTYILYNNSTQINSTQINISHIDKRNEDIDIILSLITTGQQIYIQDENNSSNNQKFNVIGTPSNINPGLGNSYWQFPVSLISATGLGYTNFPNNYNVLIGIFSPSLIGPQGFQGNQGFQGPQGFQGTNGPQGFQGNQGFQGPTGPQGFQGNQGFQGPSGINAQTQLFNYYNFI